MDKKILISIFFLLILLSEVIALGIAPARVETIYSPGKKSTVELTIIENDGIERNMVMYAEGPLSEYITITPTNFKLAKGENKKIEYSFILPNEIEEFGKQETMIIAKEEVDYTVRDGIIGAKVAVAHQFWVYVPYPYTYAESKFTRIDNKKIELVQKGAPLFFDVETINLGSNDTETYVELIILDNGIELDRMASEKFMLNKEEVQKITFDWYPKDANALLPGKYELKLITHYEGGQTEINNSFKIGDILVKSTKIEPEKISTNKLSKIKVYLENFWGETIDNVYVIGKLQKKDGALLKTTQKSPSVSLLPWEKANTEIFLEIENYDEGMYELIIETYFNQTNTTENYDLELYSETKPETDTTNKIEPEPISNVFLMGVGMVLVSIIIIVIIIVAGYVIINKNKNKI